MVKELVRFLCYLSFKAASASAGVWFALLEAGGRGPLSWVLSGEFFRTHRNLSQGKDGQGGVTAATDMEGHTCEKGQGKAEEGKRMLEGTLS